MFPYVTFWFGQADELQMKFMKKSVSPKGYYFLSDWDTPLISSFSSYGKISSWDLTAASPLHLFLV